MTKCCINCFNEIILKGFIEKNGTLDSCSYCNAQNVLTCECSKLHEKLEFLTYVLEKDVNGKEAYEIIDDAFSLFGDTVKAKKALFESITENKYGNDLYKLAISYDNYKNDWDSFCKELKYMNRFFPNGKIYSNLFNKSQNGELPVFSSIFEQLELKVSVNHHFYRARISDVELTADEMGAPPRSKASSGRANPNGIAYMYLADDTNTCISEVRPYKGADIYVSEVKSQQDRTLIDLTSPRQKFSIMSFEDDQYAEALAVIDLLEAFSSSLSDPIKPHLSNLDYIPTQFLCEYFKSLKSYDGIIFNSSVGSGKNFVFFNASGFNISEPTKHNLKKISYDY